MNSTALAVLSDRFAVDACERRSRPPGEPGPAFGRPEMGAGGLTTWKGRLDPARISDLGKARRVTVHRLAAER
jgi:hypothetical protein